MTNIQAQDALVQGLLDAGCSFTTNLPGSQSHSIFKDLGGNQISLNERTAFETAYGASLAGKRSVVCIKSVGLNASLDPFLHAIVNGLNAGLVVVLIDDPEVTSSPERQDSRPIADIFGGLWLEPGTVADAYDAAYHSFEWSEKFDVPVVIRLTNQFFRLLGSYERKKKITPSLSLTKNRDKYISHWKKRDDNVTQKNEAIQQFVETLAMQKSVTRSKKGVIVVGACSEEIARYFSDHDVFRVHTYPIPQKAIKDFVRAHSNISTLEQGRNYLYRKIKEIVVNDNVISSVVADIPNNLDGWKVFDYQENLFLALKNISPSFVVGDEGQFTDETTKSIEVCLCMGSSVGVAMGLALAGVDYPFAVTGDTSFLHGGMQSLQEALHRKVGLGVIVIDNGGSKTTGGQKIAGNIYNLPRGIASRIISYQEHSSPDIELILNEMKKTKSLSVLFVQDKS